MIDVAIIGCGVVGAAAAYELSRYPLRVAVLEAENDIADGTTKANSAILHAGYDPEPGTLMARLNVRGVALAQEICARLDVPYRRCGSLVVAFSSDEQEHLRVLYNRGIANGVPELQLLSGEEARAVEPNLSEEVVAALYAPGAAIVGPWEYALAMAEVAVRNGVELRRSWPVTQVTRIESGYRLHSPKGTVDARFVVNASGISAERIHNMVAKPSFHIVPTRGEYHLLDKSEGDRVQHVIFQCPNESGKGVLVAPTVHGNLIVGPNAQILEEPSTACTADGLSFVADSAKRSVPSIAFGEVIRTFAGVRANVAGDFIIQEAEDAPGWIDLAGIKSPGLSAAPAIAEEVLALLQKKQALPNKKTDYRDGRTQIRFANLSLAEKQAMVQRDPAYGRVVCRCVTITEGEIAAALHSEIPAPSIDGVKRRCGAGMGRCQGGFCGPRILEMMCREYQCSPLDILQDKEGTHVLVEETKQEVHHV